MRHNNYFSGVVLLADFLYFLQSPHGPVKTILAAFQGSGEYILEYFHVSGSLLMFV